jgi:hypothetical protein
MKGLYVYPVLDQVEETHRSMQTSMNATCFVCNQALGKSCLFIYLISDALHETMNQKETSSLDLGINQS